MQEARLTAVLADDGTGEKIHFEAENISQGDFVVVAGYCLVALGKMMLDEGRDMDEVKDGLYDLYDYAMLDLQKIADKEADADGEV